MKYLVKLFQLAIVIVILYPIYYLWDTDRVDNFCDLIEPGMTVSELHALARNKKVELNTTTDLHPDRGGGQWMTSVDAEASFDGYTCVIIGAADSVAKAQIIKAK